MDAARCAGLYQIATTQIHIEAKDDKLWFVTATGPRVRLLNRGNLQFSFENDPESQLTFDVRDGKCDGVHARAQRVPDDGEADGVRPACTVPEQIQAGVCGG